MKIMLGLPAAAPPVSRKGESAAVVKAPVAAIYLIAFRLETFSFIYYPLPFCSLEHFIQ
jgi:hypothetical protein